MDQKNKATPSPNTLAAIIDPDWLKFHAPELKDVNELNDAMMSVIRFVFLWMIFEGKALKKNANPETVMNLSKQWPESEVYDDDIFCNALEYFQKRYIDNGSETTNYQFDDLFRGRDRGEGYKVKCNYKLAQSVLLGDAMCSEKCCIASAVLIVVHRYRNNLFHGKKWLANDLPDELSVFKIANCVLVKAIALNKQYPDTEES